VEGQPGSVPDPVLEIQHHDESDPAHRHEEEHRHTDGRICSERDEAVAESGEAGVAEGGHRVEACVPCRAGIAETIPPGEPQDRRTDRLGRNGEDQDATQHGENVHAAECGNPGDDDLPFGQADPRPSRSAKNVENLMMPRPPSWMRSRITVRPNADHPVAVFTAVRPVTQTALVALNSTSTSETPRPSAAAYGRRRSSAPVRMAARKDRTSSAGGVSRASIEALSLPHGRPGPGRPGPPAPRTGTGMVDGKGIEPSTSALRTPRSPS
jgi:hypothetical protein